MIGKHGRKQKGSSGDGLYSKLLRTSLLLILGMVVLECEAKPAESRVDPVQETKAELDNPLSDSLSLRKTRFK